MKRHFLFALLMLCVAWTSAAEMSFLTVELLYGGEMEHALATIGKITFNVPGQVMCLTDKNGEEMGCTSLHLIGKIWFTSMGMPTSTDIDHSENGTIHIFPNPTQDVLFVRGIEGEQIVRIFGMQGQLMLSAPSFEGEAQLHVGNLPDGTYLLQIGAQVAKFIKE